MDLREKILKLKQEKDALILAHNYQLPEIQDVADIVGDSLELSRAASNRKAKRIVFCGVVFMAETAKILSPASKVLIPSLSAGCFLADTVTAEDVRGLRKKYPDATFVAYVNTSAEVKAEVDICCTSANAVKVVQHLPEDRPVVFLPDRNLGTYVQKASGRDDIVLWEKGYCYVHEHIRKEDVLRRKQEYPEAKVIAHPECRGEILDLSDAVASTSGMIRYARQSSAKTFIICTEREMVYRLKRDLPEKEFIPVSGAAICKTMKTIDLEKLYRTLRDEVYEVNLAEDIINRAKGSIDRMLEVL